MPAKDIYHDAVKHALIKDGWTIKMTLTKTFLGENQFKKWPKSISSG
nr:element excision factor XisH family protein [Roseofilum sp. Belize BBD 4]